MKIGVLSDTHGKSVFLRRGLEKLGKIDALIHLGDHCSDAANLEQSLNIPVLYVSEFHILQSSEIACSKL
jgi:predicted phosphodiesterase